MIVDDEFYVKNCYSEQDQILNRGRLSLISPHYYTFAIELMNVIRSNTTEKLLLQRKNDFIKDGKRIILENKWVKRLFLQAPTTSDLSTSERSEIFEELAIKIFHCRAAAITAQFKDKNDSRHCKNGMGGEKFRTNLKIESRKSTIVKAQNLITPPNK